MGGLLHLVQRGEAWAGPLIAVPNVTAHPSTASVPITVLLRNGPLLCGFNVGIKGLKALASGPVVLASKVQALALKCWPSLHHCRQVAFQWIKHWEVTATIIHYGPIRVV